MRVYADCQFCGGLGVGEPGFQEYCVDCGYVNPAPYSPSEMRHLQCRLAMVYKDLVDASASMHVLPGTNRHHLTAALEHIQQLRPFFNAERAQLKTPKVETRYDGLPI
jgi:hypothetical protein